MLIRFLIIYVVILTKVNRSEGSTSACFTNFGATSFVYFVPICFCCSFVHYAILPYLHITFYSHLSSNSVPLPPASISLTILPKDGSCILSATYHEGKIFFHAHICSAGNTKIFLLICPQDLCT